MASTKKLQLKLMVDKNNKKVIFAESDKDFVDILFSFLTMPIGNIIHLLDGKSSVGSMDVLYQSLKNLDENYFNTKACKSMLLNPLNSIRSHYTDLILRVDSDEQKKIYQCEKPECATKLYPFYSSSPDAKCGCGEIMSLYGSFCDVDWKGPDGDGVFVEGNCTYIISDDMSVMCPSTLNAIQNILDKLEIRDLDNIEEAHIDFNESLLLDLLRRSLISNSPLSGVYFQQPITTSDSKCLSKLHPILDKGLTDKSESLTANLVVCKSTMTVLYAESKGEEVTVLLSSFLTYPLGSIVMLLNKCSSIGCIDNLYQSAHADFVKSDVALLDPKLAPFFGCKASLPLVDEMAAERGITTGCSICHYDGIGTAETNECKHGVRHISMSEMNPKLVSPSEDCGGGYVKKGLNFMITDDLELSPNSPLSIMQVAKKRKLIVADLEVKEIKIGKNEALSLLKACLTSMNPLSDVFAAEKKGVHAA